MQRYCRMTCCATMFGLSLFMMPLETASSTKMSYTGARADVQCVITSDEPERGVREVHLEEIWRVGGEEESVLLGLIGDVKVGPDGNYYVLDLQLSQIQVFAPDGCHLRTIGRRGEGPGEFTTALEMAFLPDGSLGVAQGFPGRLIGLHTDGSPRDNIDIVASPAGGFTFLSSVRQGGGMIVVSAVSMKFDQDAVQTIVLPEIFAIDQSGDRKFRYWENEFRVDAGVKKKAQEAHFDTPDRRYAVGADGRVAIAPGRNDYSIHVYDRRGRLERIIKRPYESWRRNATAISYARFFAAQICRAFQVGQVDLEETEPDITELRWAPDGSLWVMTGRALYQWAPGVFCEYDVFSPSGRYVEKIRVMLDADPRLDLLLLPDAAHALVVRGFMDAKLGMMGTRRHGIGADELEPLQLICYRILW